MGLLRVPGSWSYKGERDDIKPSKDGNCFLRSIGIPLWSVKFSIHALRDWEHLDQPQKQVVKMK